MRIRTAASPRLLLAGVALSMPLLLLAEPMKMPPAEGYPAMPGMGAHPHMCGQGMPFEGAMMPLPPFLREANLDETQRDKIFQIMYAQLPQLREQEKARFKAHRALAELSVSGEYSDAKAKALADTLARATAETELMRARSENQIMALLTPEQRSAIAKMQKTAGTMHPPMPPHMPPCEGQKS